MPRLLTGLLVLAVLAAGCRKVEPADRTGTPAADRTPAPALAEPEPEPVLLSVPEPDWPDAALQSGMQGRVIVRVEVDEQGNVTDARVEIPSGHRELDEAALKAARQARFEPATKDGVPVASHASLPFGFWLK